jgi:hypothetical protein
LKALHPRRPQIQTHCLSRLRTVFRSARWL